MFLAVPLLTHETQVRLTTAQGVTLKRILLPAAGAIIATGLLAAGLAGAAQATPTQASDPLAAKPADAASVANFWYAANGAP